MTAFANKDEFIRDVVAKLRSNNPEIADIAVNGIRTMMEANIGRPTKLSDAISYEIQDDEIRIVSSTPIVTFLDKGTKPHIIRPKRPGGSLKFRAQESVVRKDGSKLGFGDDVFAKQVKHPGTPPQEFVSQALFLNRKKFIDKLFSSSTPTSP